MITRHYLHPVHMSFLCSSDLLAIIDNTFGDRTISSQQVTGLSHRQLNRANRMAS